MHFWSYTMPNFCLLSVPLSTALSCKPCTAATHACVALSHWSDPCFGQITEHCSAKSENKGICLMLNTRLNACLVWVCRFLRYAFSISFASPCTCDKQASRPDCFDASHRLPLFLAVGFPLDADSRRRIIRTEVSASATRTGPRWSSCRGTCPAPWQFFGLIRLAPQRILQQPPAVSLFHVNPKLVCFTFTHFPAFSLTTSPAFEILRESEKQRRRERDEGAEEFEHVSSWSSAMGGPNQGLGGGKPSLSAPSLCPEQAACIFVHVVLLFAEHKCISGLAPWVAQSKGWEAEGKAHCGGPVVVPASPVSQELLAVWDFFSIDFRCVSPCWLRERWSPLVNLRGQVCIYTVFMLFLVHMPT